MGLDMYLTKKTGIYANYDFEGIKGEINLTKPIKKDGEEVGRVQIPIQLNRVTSITEEVMYWRKANQIHKWFVDNVQDGTDDCGVYDVEIEQLEELLDLCKQIQADHDKAEELLPTQAGFFFGSQSFDKWYFEDIDNTVKALENVIKEDKENTSGAWITYQYTSSW